MRKAFIGGIVALVALVVVIVIRVGDRQSGQDVFSTAPGVFHDPPFTVRLDGALWQSRTLQDNDGAQDFAWIERDLPLDVRATGTSKARIAELELRLDGKRRRVVVPPCPSGRCPVSTSVSFLPPLRSLPPGEHSVEIVVRDRAGHTGISGFSVRYVNDVPATTEGKTISTLPAPGTTSDVSVELRRRALSVLAADRRTGGLAAALGGAGVSVLQAGPLVAPERPVGVTLLVALTPPRYDVSATVPAYVPVVGSGPVHYATQEVQMNVAVLRDALIDVDLATGRVITFEPGPDSRTSSWSPSKAPTPAGAADED